MKKHVLPSLALGAFLITCTALPVYAGFSIRSSTTATVMAPETTMPISDNSEIPSEDLARPVVTPLVMDEPMPAPMPQPSSSPLERALKAAAQPAPTVPDLMPEAATAPTLQGFASDVPLALALRQVVPPMYKFAYGPNVDLGERVNWQGGKPWNQVLQDMAARNNLAAQIDEARKTVNLRRVYASSVFQTVDDTPISVAANVVAVPAMEMADEIVWNVPPAMPVSLAVAPSSQSPLNHHQPHQHSERMKPSVVADAPLKTLQDDRPVVAAAQPSANDSGMVTLAQISEPSVSPVSLEAEEEIITPSSEKEEVIFDMPRAQRPAPVSDKKILVLPTETSSAAPAPMVTTEPQAAATMPEPVILPDTMLTTDPESQMTSVPEMSVATTWTAKQGQTLSEVLREWSSRADVSLMWRSEYDYPLDTDLSLNGNFEDAVRTVLIGLSYAQPSPAGRLHRNSGKGRPVLVIDNTLATN